MRWQGDEESANVEDRRGQGRGRPLMVGGGIGTLVIVIVVALLGGDPRIVLQIMNQVQNAAPPPAAVNDNRPIETTPEEEQLKKFVSVVLRDTEVVWGELFLQQNRRYQDPKLVLFRNSVNSACGQASTAVGPFYCPGDRNVYIDLSFYNDLKRKLNAPGDFAQAYVIAHEVGHHVQNLLGISDQVHALRGRVSEAEYNKASVRLELQADFLAGVWAHHAQKMKNILEEGDIEEALNAASQIGDDRLQKRSTGYVVPDSFTHGTSQQRVRWFTKGFKTGDMKQGDTFKIPYDQL
ncbi:MAG: neutral zinc metallopeptidase [Planctomycetales bacterium]